MSGNNNSLALGNVDLGPGYNNIMYGTPNAPVSSDPILNNILQQNGPNALGYSGNNPVKPEMNNWTKFGLAANGVTGLLGAFNAYKQLGLMRDQFNFNKSLANRNIQNQATAYNTNAYNRTDGAAQLYGHSLGSTGYQNYMDRNYNPVDDSPIK